MTNKYYHTRTGTRRMRETTIGWMFLVQWSDGTHQWIDLKVLKESNPLQVGEYVISHVIQDEPCFCLVGAIYYEEAGCYCLCHQVKAQEDLAKVWY